MEALRHPGLEGDERYNIVVSYGTIIGTGVLSLMVCTSRLFTRAFLVKNFGLDDWACLVALVLTTLFNIVGVIFVARAGQGKHLTHVSTSELTLWFKLYYGTLTVTLLIPLIVKTSLILYLRRLFSISMFHRLTSGLLVLMVLFTVPFTFVGVFQCNPPRYVYDLPYVMSPDKSKHCFSEMTVYGIYLFQAILLLIFDLVILFLPVPIIRTLNLKRGKGVVIVLILVPAVIACIAPILRIQTISFLKDQDSDITFHSAPALYWQAIEYNLGMVAGSLGCLRPMLKKIVGVSSHFQSTTPRNRLSSDHEEESHMWRARLNKKPSDPGRVQGDSILMSVTETV